MASNFFFVSASRVPAMMRRHPRLETRAAKILRFHQPPEADIKIIEVLRRFLPPFFKKHLIQGDISFCANVILNSIQNSIRWSYRRRPYAQRYLHPLLHGVVEGSCRKWLSAPWQDSTPTGSVQQNRSNRFCHDLKKEIHTSQCSFLRQMGRVAPEVVSTRHLRLHLYLENHTNLKLGGRAAIILFKTYLSRIGLFIW